MTDMEVVPSPKTVELKYVYVPADTASPLQELTYVGPEPQLGSDAFVETLKTFFGQSKSSSGSGGSADKEKLLEGLRHHAGAEAVGKLSDDMLHNILNSTQIDMFPVLMPTPDAEHRGVTVYVDDKGVSKNLQRNDRLSRFAQDLGYTQQVFIGDGFVGRVHDSEKDDIWAREDFRLSELSSDAPWALKAAYQVKNKRSAQDVANFKNQFLKKDHTEINQHANAKQEDRVGLENNYAFRDIGDELELVFQAEAVDKKAVKVIYAKGGRGLYVEYAGEELFGEEFFSQAKADADEKFGVMAVKASGSNKPAMLFGAVEVEDCSWSLVDKKLVVTLMKKGNEQWPRILASSD